MPVPDQVPISHYRGDTLSVLIRAWADSEKTEPVDLTGVIVTSQVRSTPEAPVLATFDCTVGGTDSNEISLLLTPDEAAHLPTSCVYDIQLDWSGDGTQIQTILRGPLDVPQDVTRPVS